MLKCMTFLRSKTLNTNLFKTVIPITRYNSAKLVILSDKCSISVAKNARYRGNTPNMPLVLIAGIATLLGMKEKAEEEKESELITTIKRGILLIQKEEFKKAEQMLHLALKIAQEQKNNDGVTYVYDVLANLAFDTGELSKAEKLFVNVVQRLMMDGVEANDNRILHISLKISKIYELWGENSKAEEGYKFCVENLEQKVNQENDRTDDTLILCGLSLDIYARFLVSQNRLREAFSCFIKAYDICVEVFGKEYEHAAVLLNDLGTVSNLLGNQERAVSFFEQAVTIGERLPEMKHLGSVYVNLGRMYLLKNMLSESEKACSEGRRSAIKYEDKETENEANKCLKEVQGAMKG